MAIRVTCQECHHDGHLLAVDLIAHGLAPDSRIEDVRFRCSTCRSRRTRAHVVDLDATPAGFLVVQRLPAGR